LKVLDCIMEQIDLLEKQIQKIIKPDSFFALLKTIPGIGPILAARYLMGVSFGTFLIVPI